MPKRGKNKGRRKRYIEQIRQIMGQNLPADQVELRISSIMKKTYKRPQQLIDDLDEFKNMCSKPEFLAAVMRCIPYENFDQNVTLETGLIGKIIEWGENTIVQHNFDRQEFKDHKVTTAAMMKVLCTFLDEKRNRKNGLISLSSLMDTLYPLGLKGFNTNTLFKSLIKSAEDQSLNEREKKMIIDVTSSLICGMITHDSEGKKIKDREVIMNNLSSHQSKINSVEVLKSVIDTLSNDMDLDYISFIEDENISLEESREKMIIGLTRALICDMIIPGGEEIKDRELIMNNLWLHQSKINSVEVLKSVIDTLAEDIGLGTISFIEDGVENTDEKENLLRFIKNTGEKNEFNVEDQVDTMRLFMLCTNDEDIENHYYNTLKMFERLGETSEDLLDKVLSFKQTYDKLGLVDKYDKEFLDPEQQSLDRTLQMLEFFSENMPETNVAQYEAKMKQLIDQYMNSNSYNDESKMVQNDNSALISACHGGNITIAKFLLDLRAKIDQTDSAGGTPLYYACMFGHTEIAKLLVQKGADIQKATNTGATPIFIAFDKGHDAVVELLLEGDVDFQIANSIDAVVKLLLEESTGMPKANRIEAVLDYIAKKKDHPNKSLESANVTSKQKKEKDKALEKIFDSAIKTIRRIKRAEYRAWLDKNKEMGNNNEELAQLGYLEKLNSKGIKSYFLDPAVKLDTLQLYFQDKYGDEYKSEHKQMTVEEAKDLQLINIRAYCEYIRQDIADIFKEVTGGSVEIGLDEAKELMTGAKTLRSMFETKGYQVNEDDTLAMSYLDKDYKNDDFSFVLTKTRGIPDNHSPVSVLRGIFNTAHNESVAIKKSSFNEIELCHLEAEIDNLEVKIDDLRKEVYYLLDKEELNPEESAWLNKIKEVDKINKKEIIINQLEIDVKKYQGGKTIDSPNAVYKELVEKMAKRQGLLEKFREDNNTLEKDQFLSQTKR